MVALALHELGHALGLGHSPVQEDVLYPVTRANDLSDRDRRTARLLYSLPPGDLR
jgi:predicted Zn-dependent protease